MDEKFQGIICYAKAFRIGVSLYENFIQEKGIRGKENNYTEWCSFKTASLFNLHNAFELGLKGFLVSSGISFSKIHSLTKLYDKVPGEEKGKLEALFNEVFESPEQKIRFIAFNPVTQTAPPRKLPFQDCQKISLKELLVYFDKYAELWKKRYEWEDISKGEWTYYTENLLVLLDFPTKLELLSVKNLDQSV